MRRQLCKAVDEGRLQTVKQLLDQGAPIDALDVTGDITALHIAAMNGDIDMVRELLRRGATVDYLGNDDVTPLHEAAEKGHLEVVRSLVAGDS